MQGGIRKRGPYYEAYKEAELARRHIDIPQTRSGSYKLSYQDTDFLLRDELRPVRLQLELLKPELIQHEQGIEYTVVIFGSSRTPDRESAVKNLSVLESEYQLDPDDKILKEKLKKARRDLENSKYYEAARSLSRLISNKGNNSESFNLVVTTGGGQGIMEGANRGAHEAGAKSVGLNIVLPFEQRPNAYITPELSFQFHYFAIRKMHFLMRAKALVVFPGGFGTMDELFETLTLVQTKKIKPIPILLFGRKYWKKLINFDMFVEEGMISPEDLELFRYVDTPEEAWEILRNINDDM
jgi:uncharacterized protein (TIGR00730 family)